MAPLSLSANHKWVLVVLLLVGVVAPPAALSDFASDRDECANQLAGLATCIPYVQGEAAAPTPGCCSGLKGAVAKSIKCLCMLIKDRNEPQLGFRINVSLALDLPSRCSVPSNVSDCPRLLNLAPNSTDAQIFEQYARDHPAGASAMSSGVRGNESSSSNSAGANSSRNNRRSSKLTMAMSLAFFVFLHVGVQAEGKNMSRLFPV
ncbi:non-specific lipid transfer protein GPI-anchored 14-like [Curcuma longa]|uniref:non-specific lipid transfer protein GPI-anchored 14-like n=1 Tax=Curcuma longa TaxID=136217 RepID=UPI003D9FA71C